MNFLINKQKNSFLKKSILALVLVFILFGTVNPNISLAQQVSTQTQACLAANPGNPSVCNISNANTFNNAINNPTTNTATGPTAPTSAQLASNVFSNVGSAASDWLVEPVFKFIGWILMGLSAAILSISGFFFDYAVQETILKMATRINTNEAGIGVSINDAWKTLRDIANMFFILVLLFTAFKAMFQLSTGNIGRTILNIIIVALLINFSLFFTKVVIDASNVVAVGFYNSIVSSSRSAAPATEGTQEVTQASISSGYMRLLGLQSWFSPGRISDPTDLTAGKILITGVFSSVFMLITAVILFIMGIMLVARWVILVFLMILSPVAFIAIIIPGLSSNFDKWKNAVIDQSFFAPLFFAMTWVTFRVAAGLRLNGNGLGDTSVWYKVGIDTPQTDAVGLIFNYFIIMGFAIASLIFAKQMASKTAYFTSITGGIGAGVTGGAAFMSRQTIGRASNAAAQSTWLKNKASQSGLGAVAARAGLWTANKGAGGSFDVRAVDTLKKIPGLGKEIDILGKSTNKGGFSKAVEEKAKRKAAYAKAVYGQTPTDDARDKAAKESLETKIKNMKAESDSNIISERKVIFTNTQNEYKAKNKLVNEYERSELSENFNNLEELKKSRTEKEKEIQKARVDGANELELESLRKESESLSKSIEIENQTINEKRKEMEDNDEEYITLKESAEEAKQAMNEAKKNQKAKIKDTDYSKEIQDKIKEYKEFKNSGNQRQEKYAKRVKNGVFGWTQGNQAAAKKIEGQIKDVSKEKKLADLVKEMTKEEEKKEDDAKEKEEKKEEKKEGEGKEKS